MQLAIDNGHETCVQLLRNNNAPEKTGNRAELIKKMAEDLIQEHPDYRKSMISTQKGEKVEKMIPNRKLITRLKILEAQALK